MKQLLTIGLIGGVLILGSRLFSAKRLSDRSVVRTLNPRITRITLAGITVATDVYIDNPTNASVTVTKPVVTLTTGGKYIASSIPVRNQFTIAPLSQTSMGTIEIEVPWTGLTPYLTSLVSRIPTLIGKSNVSLQTLQMPLEYYYTLYVDNLFYQSPPEPLV